MKIFVYLFVVLSAAFAADAAWYWPFGNSDSQKQPRLSALMEKASLLIDDAEDLAADGKPDEAAAKYREALAELDRVEAENPERAATPEFASLRNKRAYVSAAVDNLLMKDAQDNAMAVAVSDTTELERKFAKLREDRRRQRQSDRRAGRPDPADPKLGAPKPDVQLEAFTARERERNQELQKRAAKARARRLHFEELQRKVEENPDDRDARLALAGELLARERLEAALAQVGAILARRPGDVAALNLRAACEATAGDVAAARTTLAQAIQANGKDYNAYYNLAALIVQSGGDKVEAARAYKLGRDAGGPEDKALEEVLK